MGFKTKNDRKRLDAWTPVHARDGFVTVLLLNPTEGAANACHMSPPVPLKPDGLLQISRRNLINAFSRVKTVSVYEFTA